MSVHMELPHSFQQFRSVSSPNFVSPGQGPLQTHLSNCLLGTSPIVPVVPRALEQILIGGRRDLKNVTLGPEFCLRKRVSTLAVQSAIMN